MKPSYERANGTIALTFPLIVSVVTFTNVHNVAASANFIITVFAKSVIGGYPIIGQDNKKVVGAKVFRTVGDFVG